MKENDRKRMISMQTEGRVIQLVKPVRRNREQYRGGETLEGISISRRGKQTETERIDPIS